MPVQTLPNFKTATKLSAKGLRRGKLRDIRGANIKPIDDALGAYDLVRASYNLGAKSQALSRLLGECARWLKAKMGKNSTSSNARRPIIAQLAQDAFDELRNINRASGEDFYNLNKSITMGNQVNYGRKALSGGYSNERALYLRQNKQFTPVSAAYIHDAQRDLGALGLPNNFNNNYVQGLVNKSFGTLTENDYNTLAQAYSSLMNMEAEGVYFSDKATRSRHLMVVYPGYNFNFEKVGGTPYDTIMAGAFDPDAGHMYAVDEYGTLFASSPDNDVMDLHGHRWNHSSFNAGKDVVCAGVIKIHNGTLTFIDNNSGHYKPTRQHLFELLTIFHGEGIPMAGVAVEIREPGPMPNTTKIHQVTAVNFLANVNIIDPNAPVIQG